MSSITIFELLAYIRLTCIISQMENVQTNERVWMLFGWRGWIGGMVRKVLENDGEVVHLAESRAGDSGDSFEDLENEIVRIRPTHVVSWIGRTHGDGINTIDYLEQPGKLVENLNDNLFATFVLAQLGEKYGFHLTSGGTGCIFESSDEKPEFDEEDRPNFFGSSYSIVKGIADRMMRYYPRVLNARIRMPIDDALNGRDFISKILAYAKNGKIHSVQNSMTVLPELIPVLIGLAKQEFAGTLNLTNPGTISHDEILGMYRDMVDPSLTWTNVDSVEGLVVAKRSNNKLNTGLLETLRPDVLNIREAVKKCIETMQISDQKHRI